jgi:hypothetical protein
MILYNYKGQPNTINKALTPLGTINVALRPELNVHNPTLKIQMPPNIYGFNYVYLEDFRKYYFVDNFRYVGGNTCLLTLSLDVLQTYQDVILQSTALIVESDHANRDLSVNSNVFDVFPKTDILRFPTSNLFDKKGSIIMVTLKGNK